MGDEIGNARKLIEEWNVEADNFAKQLRDVNDKCDENLRDVTTRMHEENGFLME